MAGDKVMVTAFEHNPLATLVLTSGRRLCALVGNQAKVDTVGRQVKGALATAMTAGWFKELAQADVPLGGSVLPTSFPPHNISQSSQESVENLRAGYDDDHDDDGSNPWCLDHAKDTAEDYGLEIRVGVAFRMKILSSESHLSLAALQIWTIRGRGHAVDVVATRTFHHIPQLVVRLCYTFIEPCYTFIETRDASLVFLFLLLFHAAVSLACRMLPVVAASGPPGNCLCPRRFPCTARANTRSSVPKKCLPQ